MPRVIEFPLALIAILLLLPILLIAIVICAVSTHSSGLFLQKRIGRFGEPFKIWKLRTMKEGKVTLLGKWLRRWKIDELPQLINVLRGDMSFVGPRPDVPGYYDKLTGEDRLLLKLRPGLTSPAALKYRNEEQLLIQQANPKTYNDTVIFPDKVAMNLEYLEQRSFIYDLKVIWITIFNRDAYGTAFLNFDYL